MNQLENKATTKNIDVVIADDVTGAAEIAGVCLRYGRTVSFGIDGMSNSQADICVVATDSRSVSEREAVSIHAGIAAEVVKLNPARVFKKCDSVLRGFVLAELSVLLDAFGKKKALIEPSNPATGRCIKQGKYSVNNEAIEHTGFAIDPDFPAFTSSVRDLLCARSQMHNAISEIHTGSIKSIHSTGAFIPDCSSTEELKQLCSLAEDDVVACGSAAFFEQLYFGCQQPKEISQDPFTLDRNFLLVAGTTHPESKRFAEKLIRHKCPVIKFPDSFLEEQIDEKDFDAWMKVLAETWNKKKMMSIGLSDKPVRFSNSKQILKSRLSKVCCFLMSECAIDELLIEGGATTYSILAELKPGALTAMGELAPGVLRMKVNELASYKLTIKPGSYPWPEILLT